MSYFAAAATRGADGWNASEFDLSGAADVDEVVDRLRDVDPDADVTLLFVEADDIYLVVLRLDEGEDLRVFGSDRAFADESRLGALLLGDVVGTTATAALDVDVAEPEDEEDAEDPADDSEDPDLPSAAPDADPVGDPDLLGDLGVPASRLLALCAHEGLLPSDVTAEVCATVGCGDAVEELREA